MISSQTGSTKPWQAIVVTNTSSTELSVRYEICAYVDSRDTTKYEPSSTPTIELFPNQSKPYGVACGDVS
jgi:hypothetical protein